MRAWGPAPDMVLPTPEELGRFHRNYAEGFWQYVRASPGARRHDGDGMTLMRCDLRHPTSNVAFVHDPAASLEASLSAAESFFDRKDPWRMLWAGPAAPGLREVASRHRLRPAPEDPGMLLSPIVSPPAPPPRMTVRVASTSEDLDAFGKVWCASFRIPAWFFPLVLPRIPPDDPARGAQNRFIVGFEDRQPVACASVTVTEGVAGVASVGTVPESRGKGYGTAITWAAVDAGRMLGADSAYLAASKMGYPVYARMGFRRVADYPSWQTRFGFFGLLRVVRTARRLLKTRTPSPLNPT